MAEVRRRIDTRPFRDRLAGSMTIEGNAGGEGTFGGGQALVLIPPESVAFLDSHGWDRRRLQREIFARASVSYEALTPAIAERTTERRRELGLADDGVRRVARTPEDVLIVVTGGVGTKATFVPTWPGGTRAITVVLPSAPRTRSANAWGNVAPAPASRPAASVRRTAQGLHVRPWRCFAQPSNEASTSSSTLKSSTC